MKKGLANLELGATRISSTSQGARSQPREHVELGGPPCVLVTLIEESRVCDLTKDCDGGEVDPKAIDVENLQVWVRKFFPGLPRVTAS